MLCNENGCGWEVGPIGVWDTWSLLFNFCDTGCSCSEPDFLPDPPGPTTWYTNCYEMP